MKTEQARARDDRGRDLCLDIQTRDSSYSDDGTTACSGLLTVNEAARYLRVSRTTLYRLIDRGEIAVVRLSVDPRFLQSDLDALIRSRREAPILPFVTDSIAAAPLVSRSMYAH